MKKFFQITMWLGLFLFFCTGGTIAVKANITGGVWHDETCECRSGGAQTVLPGTIHKFYVKLWDQQEDGRQVEIEDSEFEVNWNYASEAGGMAEAVKTDGATAWMKVKEEAYNNSAAFSVFVKYDGIEGGHKDTVDDGVYLSCAYFLSSDFYILLENPYFIMLPGEEKKIPLTARHYTPGHTEGEDIDITQYARWSAINTTAFLVLEDGTVTARKSGFDEVMLDREKLAANLPEQWYFPHIGSKLWYTSLFAVQSDAILTDSAEVTILGEEEEPGYVYFKPVCAKEYKLYGTDPDTRNDEYGVDVYDPDATGGRETISGELMPGKVYLLSIPHRVSSRDRIVTIRPLHEHECGEGVVTLEPTAEDRGEKKYFCIHCGCLMKVEYLPRLDGSGAGSEKPSGPQGVLDQNGTGTGGSRIVELGDAVYDVVSSAAGAKIVSYRASKQTGTSVTIPDSVWIDGQSIPVTGISAGAFQNNKKIKKVKIGNNIAIIGRNAFSGCTKLASVACGSNIMLIGECAFWNCTALKKFTIGAKVNSIGKKAFGNCKKLSVLTVKATKLSKKNIGKNAFSGTPSRLAVKVPTKKLKAYRKLFRSKGIHKKAKIK